jgi:diguanylate cyclase (GGDEF)-like protein
MNPSESHKILVVDDDALNRQVLGELLKPFYSVLLAKNGEQALERANRHQPDLILLDVLMPDMDGYEVLRRLRAEPATENIAVIFISGLDSPDDEAHGLKMGASDYIAKPFNATVVTARVALHLQLLRQRRMLERLANIDSLTELANRRQFDVIYGSEWRRAHRNSTTLSVALLDIDCFKQYNDRYGHPMGDRALRAVARALAPFMQRASDLAARYGGEEFALVMPETDAAGAHALAECVRQNIEQLCIEHQDSRAAAVLTVSVGGATLDLATEETAVDLFKAADDHLYRAKQEGRNRVVWRTAGAAATEGR